MPFKAGADEIDMVINIGALKDNQKDIVQKEIQEVVDVAKNQSSEKIVKVIIETALLTDEEKTRACEIILKTGAHFVKTSTGFSSGGATIQDIKLLKSIVRDQVLIKASGGIKNYETALAMLEAGANRIGTSSGVEIVSGHETM
jgi:deoxyribose-phosphate aldolase